MDTENIGRGLTSVAQYLRNLPIPGLPAVDDPATATPHRVWRGSTTKQVRFQPLPKKKATKLWHRARDFDRRTRRKGLHGGAVGHAALQVLHALLFDFLNYASGRLDPSYAAIARKANVAKRTVATAIKRLKSLGILNWARRCAEKMRDGRFSLEQETNAYAVLPPTQWIGYKPDDPPPPEKGTWGDSPRMLDLIDQAVAEVKAGAGIGATIAVLDLAPPDTLASALARLGAAVANEAKA
jgi:hypothetical protein